MKTKIMFCTLALLFSAFTGSVFGGTEGATNTFYGANAGINTTGDYDTFIGAGAGYSNTTGYDNTFLGMDTGSSNTTGNLNTFLGSLAGEQSTSGSENTYVGRSAGRFNTTGNYNTFLGRYAGGLTTGSGNVFLGYNAGLNEAGSNKLYIDNSDTSTPLIYGEFDNNLLRIHGSGHFSGLGVSKSQLHFSLGNTDTGGWITSVLDNNFWLSSGAMYDQSAGGWVQKSSDGNAVMAGSGGVGYRVFTTSGNTVGSPIASGNMPVRLQIDYSGNMGINTPADPTVAIDTGTGAYLSLGGEWTSMSSRQAKEDIKDLTTGEALEALSGLNPVKFAYKADPVERHVGFIAEDVPQLVATKDRKGLSALDIVAMLTKVVQEQQKTISTLREELNELKGKVR